MSQPIDMGGNFIENLKTPTATDYAVNKDYVGKTFIAEKGGVMRGSLSMNKNDLIGLPDTPNFGYSAVNRNYVTNQLNTKLDKAADIDMKNKKITALTTDYADVQSATNVGYVKNAVNISTTNIVTTLTDRFDRTSHISAAQQTKKMFSDTSWRMSMNLQVNMISLSRVSLTFLVPLMTSKRRLTVSKWEKGHKMNILLELASTCSNCRKVSILWQLNFSHQA